MSIARALAVLGTGLSGYGAGQDQARKQQRDDEESAWRTKTRQRQETQWQREDEKYQREQAEAGDVRAASMPVAVQPELTPDQAGPQAYRAGGGAWTGDKAVADEQAGMANSLSGTHRRVAGAKMKHGDTDGATKSLAYAKELEQEGVLDALKGIRAAMPAPESIAGTKAGFVSFEIPQSVRDNFDAKGKMKIPAGAVGQAYLRTLPDGTQIPDYRMVSPDGTKVHQESGLEVEYALTQSLQQRQAGDRDMAGRVRANAKQDAAEKAAAERAKLDDRRVTVQEGQLALNERRIGALERGPAARNGAGGAAGQAPVWDDKADTRLWDRYKIVDPMTGAVSMDGGGVQFAKAVALAQAMRNGGDTLSGLGYAFEIDNRIKEQAGGDPAKVAQMRQGLLQTLTAPPGQPAAPAAPAAPQPAAKPAAPGMAAAAKPVDRLGSEQIIGPLTPMSVIEESAAAGNKRAIEYLRRRSDAAAENSTAPRDTAAMMNGG